MSDEHLRQPPAQRFAEASMLFDLPAEIAALRAEPMATKHGHRQKTLYKHAGRTIALFVFDAGATLANHSAAGMVSVQPIEGELAMNVGGEERLLRPGNVLVMSPGVRHDVRAITAATFVLQVSLVGG